MEDSPGTFKDTTPALMLPERSLSAPFPEPVSPCHGGAHLTDVFKSNAVHKDLQEDERGRPVSTEAFVHQTAAKEKEKWQAAEWENLGHAHTYLGPLLIATNNGCL